MTSMPAFKPTHNDEKIWEITAFVTQKLSKMTDKRHLFINQKFANQEQYDN